LASLGEITSDAESKARELLGAKSSKMLSASTSCWRQRAASAFSDSMML
jgi:hypothetical protein